MQKNDEFRRNAALAQEQAQKARSDPDRESWLQVAQGWLSLIQNRPTDSEKFDAAAAERGTKQEQSDSLH